MIGVTATGLPAMRRLRLSPTLTRYIARQYLFWFCSFFFAIVAIIFLATVVDLLDRLATKEVGLSLTLKMALLKLPYLSQEVMSFTILFAAMATFWRLTRSHELVVARAAGVSVWQFLLPVLGSSLIIGMLAVTTGMVIRKMISITSITSTSGVVLIEEFTGESSSSTRLMPPLPTALSPAALSCDMLWPP